MYMHMCVRGTNFDVVSTFSDWVFEKYCWCGIFIDNRTYTFPNNSSCDDYTFIIIIIIIFK